MAVKLHRCSNEWIKLKGHPCWRVESALKDMGIDYDIAAGPLRRGKRDEMRANTGQDKYPAIQFEDGSWYRDESKEMEKTIRDGALMSRAAGTAAPSSG